MVTLNDVKNAAPGSDFHGLVERVAYNISLIDNVSAPESDWYNAQLTVSEAEKGWSHIFCDADSYHRALEWTADRIQKLNGSTPEDSWYEAQDVWAARILDYHRSH